MYCRLLATDVVSQNIFLIHNNIYIIGFHCFMDVSYTSAEAELVKAALQ